jgi:hypothetical protein
VKDSYSIRLGLLEESEDIKFKTTEKVRSFLSHYQHIARLLAGLNDTRDQHLAAQQDEKVYDYKLEIQVMKADRTVIALITCSWSA